MAVDYTKVFTVAGCYVDKVRDYYAHNTTYLSDRGAIETILAAQSLVRLEDELTQEFDDFRDKVTDVIDVLIDRTTDLFTDETLIGANFSLGTNASLSNVWPALIHDMAENDHNIKASVSTVGSITYDSHNTTVGVLEVGTILDGVTPPLNGAQAIADYMGLTTQLTPDSETVTFTCTSDSESGGIRGSEIFEITGTGPRSDPYSPEGESIGSLGSIQVADSQATRYLINPSLDSWKDDLPDGWTTQFGTPTVDFEETATVLYGSGSSIKFNPTGDFGGIAQTIPASAFTRRKAYFLSCWAARDTDAGDPLGITLSLAINGNDTFANLGVDPDGTDWEHFCLQFIPPIELTTDVIIRLGTDELFGSADAVIVDQLCISECEYQAGVAFAIFSGPDKFLVGDSISVPIANDSAGKFQSFFRKAYKVQLPTDASPSISDSLVT